jgi:IS4 transposase
MFSILRHHQSGQTWSCRINDFTIGWTRLLLHFEANPRKSFPDAFEHQADLEGFYRFIRNPTVVPEDIVAPHHEATVARCASEKEVLCVHDTTEFRFGGASEREGLGRLGVSGKGFLGHLGLAVSADEARQPLGVLGVETWARQATSLTQRVKTKSISASQRWKFKSEQKRWGRIVDRVEEIVGDATSLIHIMDSEADDYTLLADLVGQSRRFVIRLCYDRVLDVEESGSAPHTRTRDFVATAKVQCTRRVQLSRRRRYPGGKGTRTQARTERRARLAISAQSLVFRRPNGVSPECPATCAVNIVRAVEIDPPMGEVPVEWLLITTEPIKTKKQILKVVDYYRGRWRIEEYFKALKTGCAFEKRQLESAKTLYNALALFVPIAWNLLRLRNLARSAPATPANRVLSKTQLRVLRLRLEQQRVHLPSKPQRTRGPARPCAAWRSLTQQWRARLGGPWARLLGTLVARRWLSNGAKK